jgi:hypothetical protein
VDGPEGLSTPVRAVAGIAVALAACAAGPRAQVVARGTLAYAVAAAGPDLVSIELDERFALLVRSPDVPEPRLRVDLGPPEADWSALAAAGASAYAGGVGGEVRRVDLATGQITARWPVGAAVTALATADDLLAVGDATGALCLRRLPDGALLHCVLAADGPITGVAITGRELITASAGSATAWRLPSLTRSGATRWRLPVWAGGDVVVRGRTVAVLDGNGKPRTVATLDGAVRSVAILSGSRLAIAGWVTRLDNPSIIVLAPLD